MGRSGNVEMKVELRVSGALLRGATRLPVMMRCGGLCFTRSVQYRSLLILPGAHGVGAQGRRLGERTEPRGISQGALSDACRTRRDRLSEEARL